MNAVDRELLPVYAASLSRVPYTQIRELGELAMTMDGVLRLYFGESNLPTPRFIKSTPRPARSPTATRSTPRMRGCRRSAAAIAAQYRRLHGVELDPATRSS